MIVTTTATDLGQWGLALTPCAFPLINYSFLNPRLCSLVTRTTNCRPPTQFTRLPKLPYHLFSCTLKWHYAVEEYMHMRFIYRSYGWCIALYQLYVAVCRDPRGVFHCGVLH
jgi:hypothetical protein